MRMKSVVYPIIFINIAVFILQNVLGGWFTDLLVLKQFDLMARPWTLLTSMFLHGGFNHILFNMYVLFMFGSLVEQRIGPKRFLTMYLVTGLVAAFISQFIYPAALGASGAIMGMMGVMIILLPKLRILFFFIIPMPLWIAGIVIALIDILGVFAPSGTANVAHLVGMSLGLLFGVYYKSKRKKFHKKFHKKKHMDQDDIDEYVRSGRI
jgi:uncharacterized protein